MEFARSYTMYRSSIFDERDIVATLALGKFNSEEEYAEVLRREEEIRHSIRMRSK